MRIEFHVAGTVILATLDDTAVARDFAAMLPLTLTLDSYAGTEKVADLPRKLDLTGAPAGYEPAAGDITHYAPWGNLALFTKPFRYSTGLVRLGRLEGDGAALLRPGRVSITIAPAAPANP